MIPIDPQRPMPRGVRALLRAAALATLVGLPTVGHAEPSAAQKETARQWMDRGHERLAEHDLESALEAFAAADDIMRVPTTSLALGKVQLELGLLVEGIDSLRRAARYPVEKGEPEAFATARAEATQLDLEVAARVPAVVIVVRGATPDHVTVDGEKVPTESLGLPFRVNPGSHVISAVRAGSPSATVTVAMEERQTRRVVLQLTAAPTPTPEDPPAPDPRPDDGAVPPWVLPLVGFGVGGVGLVVGAVTGGLSLSKTAALEEQCGGSVCPEARRDEHEDIITLANVSNVGLAVAGAGAIVGVVGLVLWFTAPTPDNAEGARPTFGPGGAGLAWRF